MPKPVQLHTELHIKQEEDVLLHVSHFFISLSRTLRGAGVAQLGRNALPQGFQSSRGAVREGCPLTYLSDSEWLGFCPSLPRSKAHCCLSLHTSCGVSDGMN